MNLLTTNSSLRSVDGVSTNSVPSSGDKGKSEALAVEPAPQVQDPPVGKEGQGHLPGYETIFSLAGFRVLRPKHQPPAAEGAAGQQDKAVVAPPDPFSELANDWRPRPPIQLYDERHVPKYETVFSLAGFRVARPQHQQPPVEGAAEQPGEPVLAPPTASLQPVGTVDSVGVAEPTMPTPAESAGEIPARPMKPVGTAESTVVAAPTAPKTPIEPVVQAPPEPLKPVGTERPVVVAEPASPRPPEVAGTAEEEPVPGERAGLRGAVQDLAKEKPDSLFREPAVVVSEGEGLVLADVIEKLKKDLAKRRPPISQKAAKHISGLLDAVKGQAKALPKRRQAYYLAQTKDALARGSAAEVERSVHNLLDRLRKEVGRLQNGVR